MSVSGKVLISNCVSEITPQVGPGDGWIDLAVTAGTVHGAITSPFWGQGSCLQPTVAFACCPHVIMEFPIGFGPFSFPSQSIDTLRWMGVVKLSSLCMNGMFTQFVYEWYVYPVCV